jgi:putative flippase GtrA
MSGKWSGMIPGDQHPLRHGLAFLIGGGISFGVDAVILQLLTYFVGLHPFVARLASISVAMVSGWLCHRTFTFALTTPPTVAEFFRYAAVGWLVSAINYGLFVAILLVRPQTEALVALVASSLVAMVFAYFGMRYAAFRVDGGGGAPPGG